MFAIKSDRLFIKSLNIFKTHKHCKKSLFRSFFKRVCCKSYSLFI